MDLSSAKQKVSRFSSIVICSIVRNAEKGLRRNIPVIDALTKSFDDWKVVVYENDSVDNTKSILRDWEEKYQENVFVISEDIDKESTIPSSLANEVNPFFSAKRISKMAMLRNKYLDYVEGKGWNPEYLMVVDLDVAQLYLDGIIDCFNTADKWDAITAFGYSTSPKIRRRYHDSYALCEKGCENEPQTEDKIHHLADEYAVKCKKKGNLIPVDSAFGGLAIYKYTAIKGLRYTLLSNEDDRVEVYCEHFSLNRQMAKRGHYRIFINPRMKLKYQSLTPQFIWNKLKSKLSFTNFLIQ